MTPLTAVKAPGAEWSRPAPQDVKHLRGGAACGGRQAAVKEWTVVER